MAKEITFGWELVLDLYDCDLGVISSKKKIKEYALALCNLLKMAPYGKAWIPYFGLNKPHTKGYSLLQFIETSSVTGHFSEHKRAVYLNIFSCRPYDARKAKEFSKKFFGAKRVRARLVTRA